MKTIGLIPLDSRPCNTLWLEQLSKIAGYELLMYPRSDCGDLFKGADFDKQLNWLMENVEKMDFLIISCDGLTSGGLIQARTGSVNLEKVIANKKFIQSLKQKNNKLKVYLFDTLMRTSITTLSNETAKYWTLVNEYSKLRGEIYFFNRESDKMRLEQVMQEIPKEVLNIYLEARSKKLSLNKLFVEMIAEGIADYLIILQEDSMPNGIQKIEQIELSNIIDNLSLNDKIKFYNGTDEGALILYAKIILEDMNLSPNIYLHLPYPDALNKTMLFEDRPFIENLDKMFETINMNYSLEEDSDFILSVFTEKENIDLDLSKYKEIIPDEDATYYNYVNQLFKYMNEKDVCLVDLFFPNGGTPELLSRLNLNDLTCYSAWNTASNSMGSALAHLASVIVAKHKKLDYHKLNSNFTKERILDDCIYQYIVRRKINQKYLKKNINIYNLMEHGELVLADIKRLMEKYAKILLDDRFTVSLPWNRTFEAEILIEGD